MKRKMKQLKRDDFEAKNATDRYIFYELSEYDVSNGVWYMVETVVPSIPYHSFKSYRSKTQALEAYSNKVRLEEWRSNKED